MQDWIPPEARVCKDDFYANPPTSEGMQPRMDTFCDPTKSSPDLASDSIDMFPIEVDGKTMLYGSWFCGSPLIDWTELTGVSDKPMFGICDAAPGSAFKPGGICDKPKKSLIHDVCFKQFAGDTSGDFATRGSVKANDLAITSECIIGMANCDIYWCQHCRTPKGALCS